MTSSDDFEQYEPAGPGVGLPALDGRSILVVENNRDEMMMLSAVLNIAGARTICVDGVGAAMNAIASVRFGAAVSDIGMLAEDGFDLIRQIRALPQERGGRLPVVAVTGNDTYADRDRCLQAGFQELLIKPVDPDRLLETLAALTPR